MEDLKLLLSEHLGCNPEKIDTRQKSNSVLFSREIDKDKPIERALDTSVVLLRDLGINEKLSPENLMRAIYHIAKNRGVRLTRATSSHDGGKEKSEDAKSTRAANTRMHKNIGEDKQFQTVGQYLANRIKTEKRVKSAASSICEANTWSSNDQS